MNDYLLWLFLLLPLFFALGWAAARIDLKHVLAQSKQLPRAYFQGLNYLLNDQHDLAIETFQQASKNDQHTVELQFALGSLFRRRGDLERATTIHHQLISKSDLQDKLRLQAFYELGLDYQKAGLLDHAEATFNKLSNSFLKEQANLSLLEIYQQEKNWQKAIEMSDSLPHPTRSKELAHYHCELAQQDIVHQKYLDAKEHLIQALYTHRLCVRANILSGDIAVLENNYQLAINSWLNIEQQNPKYLALVARQLFHAYQKTENENEGIHLLKSYLQIYPSLDLLEIVYDIVLAHQGTAEAFQLAYSSLQYLPTLRGVEKYIDARQDMVEGASKQELSLILKIIRNFTQQFAHYTCNTCGFKARKYYWRCPACGGWETYPIERKEEIVSIN